MSLDSVHPAVCLWKTILFGSISHNTVGVAVYNAHVCGEDWSGLTDVGSRSRSQEDIKKLLRDADFWVQLGDHMSIDWTYRTE